MFRAMKHLGSDIRRWSRGFFFFCLKRNIPAHLLVENIMPWAYNETTS